MKAELVPENGDPPIPITRDLTVIGRREFCDVQIKEPSLSKRHCVLVKTDGLLVVRDLGTTNGTKVKGQRVRWAALLPDDRLTLGTYKVRVYLGPDDLPGPSEMTGQARSGAGPGDSGTRRGRVPTRLSPPQPHAPLRLTVPARSADSPESTPVEPPAVSVAVGEDDLNWQHLQMLDDSAEDVMIELD